MTKFRLEHDRKNLHQRTLTLEHDQTRQGLQPVPRPVELVHYFGGWVEGPSKQTDRTDGGWI